MSRSSNSLKASDVITTPIKLKYTASIASSSLESYGIKVMTGVNNPISLAGGVAQDTLIYQSIKHLFYSKYLTGSFPQSSSADFNWEQSTAAYGTGDADVRIFPTGSGDLISVISIPRIIFGEKISRGSFSIAETPYTSSYIVDDGNGNLVDIGSNGLYVNAGYFTPPEDPLTGYTSGDSKNIHVGNLIYAQGLAIITNQDYTASLQHRFTIGLTAETTIYQNEVKCHLNENDFNYSQNPTVFSSVQSIPLGTLADNITGSDFRPYATTVGLYNGANELLVVGKLGTPYPIPSNTDMTFIVRWDS